MSRRITSNFFILLLLGSYTTLVFYICKRGTSVDGIKSYLEVNNKFSGWRYSIGRGLALHATGLGEITTRNDP